MKRRDVCRYRQTLAEFGSPMRALGGNQPECSGSMALETGRRAISQWAAPIPAREFGWHRACICSE